MHMRLKATPLRLLNASAVPPPPPSAQLPYEDARPQRKEWLAQQPMQPPMAKNPRAMKVRAVLCCGVLRCGMLSRELCWACVWWPRWSPVALPPRRCGGSGAVAAASTATAAAADLASCCSPWPMQNAEKLAASRKTPLVARYVHSKIAYVRAEAQ